VLHRPLLHEDRALTPPRRRYRTDLTDAQWQVLGPLIPQPKARRPASCPPAPRAAQRDAVLAASGLRLAAAPARPAALADGLPLLSLLATGRALGADRARAAGSRAGAAGQAAHPRRRDPGQPKREEHRKGGHTATTAPRSASGRKRHLLVDTLGLLLAVHVSPPIQATAMACRAAATTGSAAGAAAAVWLGGRRLSRRVPGLGLGEVQDRL